MAVYSVDQSVSQFCFNVTIVDDDEHEGLVPEQLTLAPSSATMPDLIEPPFPIVTILIQDNNGMMRHSICTYYIARYISLFSKVLISRECEILTRRVSTAQTLFLSIPKSSSILIRVNLFLQ